MNSADPTLLKIFAAEQAEHVARIRALAGMLQEASRAEREALIDDLLRRAHTLKGAARVVGLAETEDLTHGLEDTFIRLREQGEPPAIEAVRGIHSDLDRIEDILALALGQQREPHADRPAGTDELVRVDAATLDAVIRASAALVVAATSETEAGRRVEQHTREIDETIENYHRLRRTAASYLRTDGEDAAYAAVTACLDYADSRLAALRAAAVSIAEVQGRTSWNLQQKVRDLHENASRARMTPAEVVFGPFGAMVREAAQQEGKQIEFRADGLNVQADRVVLQALKDPVMHLLRNAISHGIEPPPNRSAAGKPSTGSVRLLASSQGDRLFLTVEDDGRGLDQRELIRAAVEMGLLTPGAAESASPHDFEKLVFQPGFSTAPSVTGLSGRGMGLSVVKQAVSALRGEVSVRPRPGGGTVVSLSVPLSISTQHVLLVAEHGHTFAFAASQVEGARRVPLADIVRVSGQASIVVGSDAVPLVRLSDLLQLESSPIEGSLHVVIFCADGVRVAVAVERILSDREAIIKETGLASSEAGLTAGAIPLEDGNVAVVLNVGAMLDEVRQGAWRSDAFAAPAEEPRKHSILVVDDSITTRSVERNILEAHGYKVDLAVDGVEALEKIRATPPDLIISDIAMPRMDGFELLETLKGRKETASIPVILVTSLEARQDQERGLSMGADAYIVKRKFDQRELLAVVRQIL